MRCIAILFLTTAAGFAQTITSLSDVQYWVGTGTNESALVIDFNTGSGTSSFAWGYRWDGTATGEQMLEAIAGQTTINTISTGSTSMLTGADGNLTLALDSYSFGDEVTGITYTVNSVTYTATDPNAGWWGYWTVDNDHTLPLPGDPTSPSTFPSQVANTWYYSDVGFADRQLTNDSWDGWSWSTDLSFNTDPSPLPPVAALAVPEPGISHLVLLALGVAGAGLAIRRNAKKSLHAS